MCPAFSPAAASPMTLSSSILTRAAAHEILFVPLVPGLQSCRQQLPDALEPIPPAGSHPSKTHPVGSVDACLKKADAGAATPWRDGWVSAGRQLIVQHGHHQRPPHSTSSVRPARAHRLLHILSRTPCHIKPLLPPASCLCLCLCLLGLADKDVLWTRGARLTPVSTQTSSSRAVNRPAAQLLQLQYV